MGLVRKVPEWIKDIDGLIPAAAQRYGRHPSESAIASAENYGIRDKIPLKGCNSGALIRIARGYYLDCVTWNQLSAGDRFLMMIHAHVPRGSKAIITGEAAAVMHGIPILLRKSRIALARTSRRSRPRRQTAVVNAHLASDFTDSAIARTPGSSSGAAQELLTTPIQRVNQKILPADIVTVRGRLVTDVPKTVVDISRSKVSENGLAVADAALRSHCSMEELAAVLRDYPRSPGSRRARDILAIANERTESIGESLAKRCILEAGIASLSGPEEKADEQALYVSGAGGESGVLSGVGGVRGVGRPKLLQQVEFRDNGQFVGRVDFFIPALNLVIEFDGVTKYAADSVKTTERVLVREREREKRLRNMGLDVHRLLWKDVIDGACVETLKSVAWENIRRIDAGGRRFSYELGDWCETQLTFAEWTSRQRCIDERQARRDRIADNAEIV